MNAILATALLMIAQPAYPSYWDAVKGVSKSGRPLVVFVGIPARSVIGADSAQEPFLWRGDRKVESGIMVTADGKTARWYVAEATDRELRDAVRLEVQPQQEAQRDEGRGPWLSNAEQQRIKSLWPKTIPFPDGLRFYRPTQYSQQTAVTNNVLAFSPLHVSFGSNNPNRQFPYVVPGGLHGIGKSQWRSYTGIKVGSVLAFDEIVYNATDPGGSYAANASREPYPLNQGNRLRKRSAEFGDGTLVVDLLVNDRDEAFELRMLDFTGGFDAMVAYKDRDKAPLGYSGAGKACIECHRDAGTVKYGPGTRGVARNVFSVPLLKEGTVEWDTDSFPTMQIGDLRDVPQSQEFGAFREPSFGVPSRSRGVRRRF